MSVLDDMSNANDKSKLYAYELERSLGKTMTPKLRDMIKSAFAAGYMEGRKGGSHDERAIRDLFRGMKF